MGSSGSSGNSVDWPGYMKDWHGHWLKDIDDLLHEIKGQGGFFSEKAVDPSVYFGQSTKPVFQVLEAFTSLDLDKVWNRTFEDIVKGNVFQDAVTTMTQVLKEQSDERILPDFKAGMRNINAVMSSHFVIGESLIESSILKQVAKFASDLQIELLKVAERMAVAKVEAAKNFVHYTLETSRIVTQLKTEKLKVDIDNTEAFFKWKLDSYDHAARMLGALGGGAGMGSKQRISKGAAAVSGAAAGASIGVQMGGGYGAAAGAVIGGIAGILSN